MVQFIEVATLGSGASVQALPGSKFGPFEFSRDGSLLFVEESGEKHAFRAFRAASGQEMARIDGHPSLAPTPQAHTIAVRDDDGNWRAADIGSATPDDTLWRNPDDKMHFDHRAGRLLISSSSPPSGSLPEWLRGHLTLVPEVNGAPLNAWAVDAEGRRVAVVSDAGVSVHLVNGGQRLANWPGIQLHGGGILVGARPIRDLAFVDGGKALIAYDTRNYDEAEMASRLWLWRWQATSPRLLSEPAPINMFAVSPTGNVFATAEGFVHEDSRTGRKQRIGEAQVRIWSAQTGAETHRLPMENDVYAVAFSPDGRHLAARTRKGIVVFRPRDWMEAARFEFTGRPRGSLRFALGGRVVLADAANGVQMWFLESSKSTLLRDDSPSLTYRLSADERWLATFGSTRLRVFDLESGAVVFELQYPRRKYVDMAFVGADDALVARTPVVLERVLWYAEDLIAEACLRFGRDISVDEWNRYIERGLPDAICVQANR